MQEAVRALLQSFIYICTRCKPRTGIYYIEIYNVLNEQPVVLCILLTSYWGGCKILPRPASSCSLWLQPLYSVVHHYINKLLRMTGV